MTALLPRRTKYCQGHIPGVFGGVDAYGMERRLEKSEIVETTHDFVVEMLQLFNGSRILFLGILWLLLLVQMMWMMG